MSKELLELMRQQNQELLELFQQDEERQQRKKQQKKERAKAKDLLQRLEQQHKEIQESDEQLKQQHKEIREKSSHTRQGIEQLQKEPPIQHPEEQKEPHQAAQAFPNLEPNFLEDVIRRGDIRALEKAYASQRLSPEDQQKGLMLALEEYELNIVKWFLTPKYKGDHGPDLLRLKSEEIFMFAIQTVDCDMLRWLLRPEGGGLRFYSHEIENILMSAIERADYNILSWLLRPEGGGLRLLQSGSEKILISLIEKGQLDIVKWLLTPQNAGGGGLLLDSEGNKKILNFAIEKGQFNIVKWLLTPQAAGRGGLLLDSWKNQKILSFAIEKTLMAVIEKGQFDILKWLLTPQAAGRGGLLLDSWKNQKILSFAIEAGQLDIVKWLMTTKADGGYGGFLPDAAQREREYAVRYAIKTGQFEIVKWFLAPKASGGCELLSLEEQKRLHVVALPPLRSEHFEMVKWLTLVYGSSPYGISVNEDIQISTKIELFRKKLNQHPYPDECRSLFKTVYESQSKQYHPTLLAAKQPLDEAIKEAILDLAIPDIKELRQLYNTIMACERMSPKELIEEPNSFSHPSKLQKLQEMLVKCDAALKRTYDPSMAQKNHGTNVALDHLRGYIEDLLFAQKENAAFVKGMGDARQLVSMRPVLEASAAEEEKHSDALTASKKIVAQKEPEPLTKLDEAVIEVERNVDAFLRIYDETPKKNIDARYTLLNEVLEADKREQAAKPEPVPQNLLLMSGEQQKLDKAKQQLVSLMKAQVLYLSVLGMETLKNLYFAIQPTNAPPSCERGFFAPGPQKKQQDMLTLLNGCKAACKDNPGLSALVDNLSKLYFNAPPTQHATAPAAAIKVHKAVPSAAATSEFHDMGYGISS